SIASEHHRSRNRAAGGETQRRKVLADAQGRCTSARLYLEAVVRAEIGSHRDRERLEIRVAVERLDARRPKLVRDVMRGLLQLGGTIAAAFHLGRGQRTDVADVSLDVGARRPAQSRCSQQENEIARQPHGEPPLVLGLSEWSRELDLAAGFVALLGRLLIIELQFDHSLQGGPGRSARQFPAVDKHRRRRVDSQRFPFRDGFIDFGLCVALLQALIQLQGIDPFPLDKLVQFLAEVPGEDLALVFENPIVVLPKYLGILPVDAAAGDGRRFGPVMIRQGEILEIYADLRREGLRNILAKAFSLLAAVRALEIAVSYDHHFRAGRAEAGLQGRGNLAQVVPKRVVVRRIHGAIYDVLPVRAHIKNLVLRGQFVSRVNRGFEQPWDRGRGEVGDLYFDLRKPPVQVADVSFQ